MSWLCRFGSDASRYVVKLGDYHTKEQDDFERVLSPEHIEVHRKYRTESWEHDVALMRLKGAEGKCVSFNPHTNAACLPAPGSKWGKRPASCVITGWGMTGNVGFFLHGHNFGTTRYIEKKIIYTHITCVLFKYIFYLIYFCDGKAEFSAAITSVFSVTWSFRNDYDMLIWSSRNVSYYCPF